MNSLVRIGQTDLQPSAASFRGAMRQLAGSVSVITVGRGRDISGLTVTSVTSLSAEPPSLLVCVNRSASSWPLFERFGSFAVNILHVDQQLVAEQFAGRGGVSGRERFDGVPWNTLATGVPVLANALVSIDCSIEEIIPRHSHAIVIGRVAAIQRSDQASGLAYWQGDYLTLGADDDVVRLAEISVPIPSSAKL